MRWNKSRKSFEIFYKLSNDDVSGCNSRNYLDVKHDMDEIYAFRIICEYDIQNFRSFKSFVEPFLIKFQLGVIYK